MFAIDCICFCPASLLIGLGLVLPGGLDQLALGTLELVGHLVSLPHKIIQVLGIGREPHALDGRAKHFSELSLVQIRVWHRCEQYRAGRQLLRVVW